MESWIQQDYEQWLFDNIDSGWSLEENNGTYWKFAVPYDPKTGIPLRQDVLNETI